MTKIVKTYIVTTQSLLQSVNEEGWLKNIAGKISGKDSVTSPQQSSDSTQPQDPVRSTAQAEADDPLSHVVSSILKPLTHGQTRVVVYMNRSDLTHLYLKSDEASRNTLASALLGQKVESLSLLKSVLSEADPTNQPIVNPTPTVKSAPKVSTNKVVVMRPNYKFSDLFKNAGNAECSVLLDVPTSLYDAYNKAPSTEKLNLLSQMLNHKYYAMTLSNSHSKSIAPMLDSHSGDLDAEMVAFNPIIIMNHPAAQTIKFAKQEWQEKYAHTHERAFDAFKNKPSENSIKKNIKPSTTTNSEQPNEVKPSTPETPPAVAHDDIKNIYSEYSKLVTAGRANRSDLINILNKMGKTLGLEIPQSPT